MNPYHILRAAAIGNMRRNGLPLPWEKRSGINAQRSTPGDAMPRRAEPIDVAGLDQWMADEWKMYASRSGTEEAIHLHAKVGEALFRVTYYNPKGQKEIIYEGPHKQQAVNAFNEYYIPMRGAW